MKGNVTLLIKQESFHSYGITQNGMSITFVVEFNHLSHSLPLETDQQLLLRFSSDGEMVFKPSRVIETNLGTYQITGWVTRLHHGGILYFYNP